MISTKIMVSFVVKNKNKLTLNTVESSVTWPKISFEIITTIT